MVFHFYRRKLELSMIDGINIQYGHARFTGKAVLCIIDLKTQLTLFLINTDVDTLDIGKRRRIFYEHFIIFAARFNRNDFLISAACILDETFQGIPIIGAQIQKELIEEMFGKNVLLRTLVIKIGRAHV